MLFIFVLAYLLGCHIIKKKKSVLWGSLVLGINRDLKNIIKNDLNNKAETCSWTGSVTLGTINEWGKE